MSEAITPPAAAAASLYPADGGAAAAAAALAATMPAGTGADSVTATPGTDTITAPVGADSVTAPAGTDTVAAGSESSGTAATGADSVSGGAGADSITAASYDFTLPEGFTENAELTTEAKTVMAAAGVAPDKAQGLIDLFGKAVKANADAQAAAHATEQNTWLAAINAMPEFQGPTRETSLQAIGRLFDEYGTPEAKAALNHQGIGNNPALVKMMHKIASVLTEGAPAATGRPAPRANTPRGAPQTVGQSLYPET